MKINFVKMHACGNDFLVIDNREQKIALSPDMVIGLADYKRSVGFDQLMIIENSNNYDIYLLIYNQDGSEASACGNGTRCVASLILNKLKKKSITIETKNRILIAKQELDQISVCMGEGKFLGESMNFGDYVGAHIDVGNEHVVINVSSGGSTNYQKFVNMDFGLLGPKIENDPRFPNRVNVNFVETISQKLVLLSTWERGAGATLSCGSGACAAYYYLYKTKQVDSPCIIRQKGGDLELSIIEDNIYMKGEANTSYYGSLIWK